MIGGPVLIGAGSGPRPDSDADHRTDPAPSSTMVIGTPVLPDGARAALAS
ncbi:hypothetical protein [Pseudonocardia endophytica]|nr:hypothetical protein [Pseudonocardia endophytica]